MGKIGKFDTDAIALKQRVKAHKDFGNNELNEWIFSSINLKANSNVLDLGCGFGKQSIDMLKRGLFVVAVDASRASLNELEKSSKAEGLNKSLLAIESKFDNMKLPSLEYDYVVSSYAFYYSKDSFRKI